MGGKNDGFEPRPPAALPTELSGANIRTDLAVTIEYNAKHILGQLYLIASLSFVFFLVCFFSTRNQKFEENIYRNEKKVLYGGGLKVKKTKRGNFKK